MKRAKSYKAPSNKKARKFVSKTRTDRQALYNDKKWKTYRFRFLHHNPQCYACGVHKNNGAKLHIDHILPHKGDKELFYNVTNFIPLCNTCHSIITNLFDRIGNTDTTREKIKWIDKKRKENGVTTSIKIVRFKDEP